MYVASWSTPYETHVMTIDVLVANFLLTKVKGIDIYKMYTYNHVYAKVSFTYSLFVAPLKTWERPDLSHVLSRHGNNC